MSILKTGYILMLDVLGYREYVTKTRDNFLDLWKELQTSIKEQKETIFKEQKGCVTLDVLFVSDTLFIGISSSHEDKQLEGLTIMFLLDLIKTIFSFSFKNKIFFRGAISFGEFLFNNDLNIVMGNALDEASEWYESTDWFGVILTPSAEYRYNSTMLGENEAEIIDFCLQRVVRYTRIPFKKNFPCDKRSYFAVKWFDTYKQNNDRLLFLKSIMDTFAEVKQSPRIASKYENTFHFIMFYTIPEGFSPYNKINNS